MQNQHPRTAALIFILLAAMAAAVYSALSYRVSTEIKTLVEEQRIERPMPDYSSAWASSGIRFTVNSYADRAPEGMDPWAWHESKLQPAALAFPPDPE